jgi:hypothetical protein
LQILLVHPNARLLIPQQITNLRQGIFKLMIIMLIIAPELMIRALSLNWLLLVERMIILDSFLCQII